MRRSRLIVCVVLLASAVAVVPAAIAAGPPPQAAAGVSHRPVCGPPVPGTEVPVPVLRQLRDQGVITEAEYRRLVRGG